MDYFYSVYAGGIEINDYNLTEKDAYSLAGEFMRSGYDDIYISKECILSGAYQWININNLMGENNNG